MMNPRKRPYQPGSLEQKRAEAEARSKALWARPLDHPMGHPANPLPMIAREGRPVFASGRTAEAWEVWKSGGHFDEDAWHAERRERREAAA